MNWILIPLSTLVLLCPCIKSQQNYSQTAVFECNSESYPYTCNGEYPSCRAFLIFVAKSPYNTLLAIATLTSSDQTEISKINNVPVFAAFQEGQEVIVPVNCSCSDRYYEAIATYQILAKPETYFTVANKTYQGLSTCDSLKHANIYPEATLLTGHKLRVPLRCACPTREQAAAGTVFLLTYSIGQGDTLYSLSKRFNVSVSSIREANGLSDEFSTIYPFTTILIPLPSEPSYSHTVTRGSNMLMLPPLASPVHIVKSRSKRVLFIIGIAAGAFSLIMMLLLISIFLFFKKRKAKMSSPQDLINLEIARLDRALREFKFSEIKKATGNFGPKNRIMINSSVYRGNFKGQVLAVKRNKGEADNEMKILCKINHFNLVKLRGFCEHKDEMYLVYEYMANGSLRDWLSGRGAMSCKQKIRIALDIGNGLLYLHNFAIPVYVHNDVKSSNILLDGNLRAKIARLGLARPANCEGTTMVVGTKGYLAPECLDAGPTTPKVDVYAFGVILLELITGKCSVFEEGGREILLSTKIAAIMESQNAEAELSKFTGPANGGTIHTIQMVKLSLSCIAREPGERPDMVEIVSILLKMQSNLQKACSLRNPEQEK